MVFSSPVFLFLFLPLTLLAVWLAGSTAARNAVLLAASLLFYAWGEGVYVLLMLATVLVNYGCGLAIDRNTGRRSWLVLAVVVNLAALAWFKYANFFVDTLNALFAHQLDGPIHLEPVHLPIGISFFIFHSLSYVVDVYRGQANAQRSPAITTLYLALFPQLVAGPIIRYHDVAAQFLERTLNTARFANGVRRFVIGLAKKVLIADQCARVADAIFAVPADEVPLVTAWLGAIAYALQIYFDFSGYSDMAIGLGRMLGFEFRENFDRPYIATSIRNFWQRWHISLSTWFRDYLYIPLGGNRLGPARTYLNLFIVFFLTGLWHGASWNFVVWGLVHGLFLVLERAGLGKLLERAPRPLPHLYTLLVVLTAWVLFRLPDITQGWHYILGMYGIRPGDAVLHPADLFLTPVTALALVIGALGALNVHVLIGRAMDLRPMGQELATGTRGTLEVLGLFTLFLLVAMSVASSTYSPFIYFRF